MIGSSLGIGRLKRVRRYVSSDRCGGAAGGRRRGRGKRVGVERKEERTNKVGIRDLLEHLVEPKRGSKEKKRVKGRRGKEREREGDQITRKDRS